MGLDDSLLEKEDFRTLSKIVDEKLNDLTYNIEDLEQITSTIKEGMQSTNLLTQYKSALRKVNSQLPEIEDLLDLMATKAKSDKEEKIAKKISTAFDDSRERFNRNQDEFESLKRGDRNLQKKMKDLPDVSVKGSLLSATYSETQQRYDDMPIVQVYDQEKFIEKREGQIKKIKNDAKDLNEIAVEINTKVHQQDGKLDTLNKDLKKNVDDVKEANENLAEAQERSKKSNKKTICMILIIFILVAILGVYLLYTAGYLSGGDS